MTVTVRYDVNGKESGFQGRVRSDGANLTKTFPIKDGYTKKDAENWVIRQKAALSNGDFRDTKHSKTNTLRQVFDGYLEHTSAGIMPNTLKSKIAIFNKVVRDMENLKGSNCAAIKITAHDWVNLFSYYRQNLGPTTVCQYWTVVKTALYKCEKLPYVDGHRIVFKNADHLETIHEMLKDMGLLKKGPHRTRRLTEDDETKFSNYVPKRPVMYQELQDAMKFAIKTCMRTGEIVALNREKDIDVKNLSITIRESKTDRHQAIQGRTIPIDYETVQIILRQPRHKHGGLFHWKKQPGISNYFADKCKRAGIIDLCIHDLRREGISRLLEAGMAIQETMKISGHQTYESFKVYMNLDIDKLRDRLLALGKNADHLDEATAF